MHTNTRGATASLWAVAVSWGSCGFLFAVIIWDIGTANFIRVIGALGTYLILTRCFPFKIGRVQAIGAAGCGLSPILFTIAMRESNPAAAAVWMYTAPLHCALYERIVRKRRLPVYFWIALAVALLGLWMIAWNDITESSIWGHAAGFASGTTFATFAICRAHASGTDGKAAGSDQVQGMIFWGFLGSAICCAPFFVIAALANRVAPDLPSLAAALSYGALTAVCYKVIVRAMEKVPATAATIILSAEVPLIPLGAALVTGRWPELYTVVGGALVLAASLGLSYMLGRKAPSPKP